MTSEDGSTTYKVTYVTANGDTIDPKEGTFYGLPTSLCKPGASYAALHAAIMQAANGACYQVKLDQRFGHAGEMIQKRRRFVWHALELDIETISDNAENIDAERIQLVTATQKGITYGEDPFNAAHATTAYFRNGASAGGTAPKTITSPPPRTPAAPAVAPRRDRATRQIDLD